jgi:SET domain/CXC domain
LLLAHIQLEAQPPATSYGGSGEDCKPRSYRLHLRLALPRPTLEQLLKRDWSCYSWQVEQFSEGCSEKFDASIRCCRRSPSCDMLDSLTIVVRATMREAREAHTHARLRKIRANVGHAPQYAPSVDADIALRRIIAGPVASSSAIENGGLDKDETTDGTEEPRAATASSSRRVSSDVVVMEPIKPPPSGLAWVRVRANLRTPEGCEVGYFVPYLGESESHLKSSQTLAKDLVGATADEDVVEEEGERGNDEDNEADETDEEDEEENDNSDVEENAPFDESRAGVRIASHAWNRAIKRMVIKSVVQGGNTSIPGLRISDSKVVDTLARELRITPDEVRGYYDNILLRRRMWAKYDREIEFKEQLRLDLLATTRAELIEKPGVELASDSITMLFCRQCYSFDCIQHGIVPTIPSVVIPDGTRMDAMAPAERREITDRCANVMPPGGCWFSRSDVVLDPSDKGVADVQEAYAVLSQAARDLFKELRQHMGDDYCRICEMIRTVDEASSSLLRCVDVGVYASSQELVSVPKLPKPSASGKNKSRSVVPPAEIEAMMGGRRLDYTPCSHKGPCTQKVCICAQTGVNCEKYCSCNHTRVSGDRTHTLGACPRSFRGCNCKSSAACLTNQCICVSTRRECDPDLCRSCGAGNAPGDATRPCCNVGLRLGSRYRTIAGRSTVHGWGVFAGEVIPKNVLVGEYIGEVIRQEEAERRGRVYDELDYSFLFNITEKYAVDSTRMGSKLKYCNHSKAPNCEPRLMRVGGDVRVGIYAKRPIVLFEELFFDYGYNSSGPSWAHAGPSAGISALQSSTSSGSLARTTGGRGNGGGRRVVLSKNSRRNSTGRGAPAANGVSRTRSQRLLAGDLQALSGSRRGISPGIPAANALDDVNGEDQVEDNDGDDDMEAVDDGPDDEESEDNNSRIKRTANGTSRIYL